MPNHRQQSTPAEGYALSPCPFCGNKNDVLLEKPGDYTVRCWGCGASSTDAPNANYVIWIWNRRAPSIPPEVAGALRIALRSERANAIISKIVLKEGGEIYEHLQTETDNIDAALAWLEQACPEHSRRETT